MTEEDNYEGEYDFDPEEDQARLEHYIVNGDAPMLMPSIKSISGRNYYDGYPVRRSD